jgi:hypothetical protein
MPGWTVSIKETSVCIVDSTGQVIREFEVTTEPEAILAVLADAALILFITLGRYRYAPVHK